MRSEKIDEETEMKYEVSVDVMPLEALLDPQGKAVQGTIAQLGYKGVENVRIGKHIVLHVEAESEDAVRSMANELCAKLLSNPVMEGFTYSVKALK